MRCRVRAAPVHDDVVGLDILVPELVVVIGIERNQQVSHVTHRLRDLFVAQARGAAERVHPLCDERERFAGHEAHHIIKPFRGHLMLEHESELARGVQGPALSHDLGQTRTVVEREHLDNDLVDLTELALGKDGLLDLVWLGDVELAARAAALE